jgi:uncharacterized protein YfiM (DUF2279 family)
VFDLIVVIVSLVFPILLLLTSFGIETSLLVLRVFRLGRLFKAMRLFGAALRFRIIMATFLYLFPMMWRVLALLAAVLVAYGIVGMELFGGTAMVSFTDGVVSFDSSFAALLTVFQLFTTSNWHTVMYAAMQATTGWASIYFISFFFMVVRFVTVLLLALIIESFSMAIDTFGDAASTELAAQPAVASAAASAAAAAQPLKQEWTTERKRRFSFTEMFEGEGGDGDLNALTGDLAAAAGVESEQMAKFIERTRAPTVTAGAAAAASDAAAPVNKSA